MTAIATHRIYRCAHCAETFTNPVVLGGHVHAQHPEHHRLAPKFLRTSSRPRPQRPSLKRETDRWPGKP